MAQIDGLNDPQCYSHIRPMFLRKSGWVIAGIGLVTVLYGFQQPWRLYRSMEPYDNVALASRLG